jgi:hypothetical protein
MNDKPVYQCTRSRVRQRRRRRRRARAARLLRRQNRIMRNQLYGQVDIPLVFEGIVLGELIFA